MRALTSRSLLSTCMVLLVGSLAAACGSGASTEPAPRDGRDGPAPPATTANGGATTPHERQEVLPVIDAHSRKAVRDHMRSMSLDERTGQLVMTKLSGLSLTQEEQRTIAGQHLGGVILFAPSYRDAAQVSALIADAQVLGRAGNRAGIGLLVSVDQEGGPVKRLGDRPPMRSQPQIGAGDDPEAASLKAWKTGRSLRDLGFNMNLAPVADIDAPPRHVMRARAFGSDPNDVAGFTAAAVTGMQEGGVSATVKHFPGLGSSTANSDFAVSYVDLDREELTERDLVPFRAAIDAGVDAVMMSHAIYRGWGSTKPASISDEFIGPLLRDELGFEGVVITDSLNARGLVEEFDGTVPQSCPVVIASGADIALVTGSMETARLCRQRIRDAVRDGTLSEQRLNDALERVLLLKHRHGLVPALEPASR